jgi:hypothetical protein
MNAAPLNGHNLSADPLPEPAPIIAQRFYEAEAADGDTPYADLPEHEREQLTDYVRGVLNQHMRLLSEQGFRILPPGAVLRPKNDQEAGAMQEALRIYAEAKARKGGLIGSVAPKKLILPPGSH